MEPFAWAAACMVLFAIFGIGRRSYKKPRHLPPRGLAMLPMFLSLLSVPYMAVWGHMTYGMGGLAAGFVAAMAMFVRIGAWAEGD
ncbi:hypothetical protein [Nocardioides xinjiangensis]|uniref:hypothetical protein n=1 Tax=Nocardioides xinjiangensis TaxID=2817376 RepID=UPI001B3044A0|nr:hypothetical protein [Nocardioides sp. SYSU D00778]